MPVATHTIPPLLQSFIQHGTVLTRSPGRINLIGEHTDYNEGFVLPAAIDKAAFFALTPGSDETITLRSLDFNEEYQTSAAELKKSTGSTWPNYILGVADQFRKSGIDVKGFHGVISGEIPLGAGLSSSAAVECAVAFALNETLQAGFTKLQLVQLAQRAENEFVGVRCGIMDQFASVFGIADHVIRLDCRSLEFEYVPFRRKGLRLVLFDSAVKHSLASSEYNLRRRQCEEGVSIIQQKHPAVKSLRDVTTEMLPAFRSEMGPVIFQRCNYVVHENQRVLAACEDLKKNDLVSFGQKMFETHASLSREYEVSCRELDFLVEAAGAHAGVLGARMMGGGFGGCTINLVEDSQVDPLMAYMKAAYHASMKKDLAAHVVKIDEGTSRIN